MPLTLIIPLVVLTHEFKDIWHDVKKSKNIFQAFMYIFGPPGWSPMALPLL